jgi:predicted amidohydrolase
MFALLQSAARDGVDLAVLPEMSVQGYGYDDADDVARDALELSDPVIGRIRDHVRSVGLHAVVGFIERDGDRLFNTTAAIADDGEILGTHRKLHLPGLGADRFVEAGDREPGVIETPVGQVGMLICADMIFPEAARVAALKGADVIAISACVPDAMTIYADHLLRVRAYENCTYVVYADMCGPDGDWRYNGRSQIIDPAGTVLAEARRDGDDLISATVDVDQARTKIRVREAGGGIPHPYEVDFFGRRRPGAYGPIVAPVADRAQVT